MPDDSHRAAPSEQEAEAILREFLATSVAAPSPVMLNMLGLCRLGRNGSEEAATLFEEANVANRSVEGDLHLRSLNMRFNLASALVRLERYPEAADALREALAGHLARPSRRLATR